MAAQEGKAQLEATESEVSKKEAVFWPVAMVTTFLTFVRATVLAQLVKYLGMKDNINPTTVKERLLEVMWGVVTSAKAKVMSWITMLLDMVKAQFDRWFGKYITFAKENVTPTAIKETVREKVSSAGAQVQAAREDPAAARGKLTAYVTELLTTGKQLLFSRVEKYVVIVRENAQVSVVKEKALAGTVYSFNVVKDWCVCRGTALYSRATAYVTSPEFRQRCADTAGAARARTTPAALAVWRWGQEKAGLMLNVLLAYVRSLFDLLMSRLNENKRTAQIVALARTTLDTGLGYARKGLDRLEAWKNVPVTPSVTPPVTPAQEPQEAQ